MEEKEKRELRKEIKAATELARSGKQTTELYDRLSTLHKSGHLDRDLFLNFGWLIYYNLKYIPVNNVLPRKRLMVQYLNLDLERPSLLHSLMLVEAIKLKKKSPAQFRFRDFVELWGLANLRDEDWENFKPENGRAKNSLVENLIGVYVHEIGKDHAVASEEFSRLLDKAIEIYRSNPHLPLYRAVMLEAQGRKEEALTCYCSLLKRWPRKFYLWSRAEALLPASDLDTRIALLCKAVTLARDKTFLGDIRLRLANVLHRKGMHHHAKHELNQYLRLYTSQRWQIKNWHETLSRRVEAAAPGVAPVSTPYDSFMAPAMQFLQ